MARKEPTREHANDEMKVESRLVVLILEVIAPVLYIRRTFANKSSHFVF